MLDVGCWGGYECCNEKAVAAEELLKSWEDCLNREIGRYGGVAGVLLPLNSAREKRIDRCRRGSLGMQGEEGALELGDQKHLRPRSGTL